MSELTQSIALISTDAEGNINVINTFSAYPHLDEGSSFAKEIVENRRIKKSLISFLQTILKGLNEMKLITPTGVNKNLDMPGFLRLLIKSLPPKFQVIEKSTLPIQNVGGMMGMALKMAIPDRIDLLKLQTEHLPSNVEYSTSASLSDLWKPTLNLFTENQHLVKDMPEILASIKTEIELLSLPV